MSIRQGLMKRLLMILAAAGMAWSSAMSGIGDWKNFTAMNSVRGVASSRDSVWAATSGGAFLYTLRDSSFVRITNSEGLTTNDLTAITVDKYGSVWFGQSDGSIDVYAPATGRWRYIRDIAIADKVQKSISSFYASGDSLYIGTAFGVSLFSIPRFEFIDTYANFGTLTPPPVLSVVAWNKRVFAATASGIAVSRASAVNLAAPESWEGYTSNGGMKTLTVFNGNVLAAGDAGMFMFNGSTWIQVGAALQPVIFRGQSDAVLYFSRGRNVFSYAVSGAVSQVGTQIGSTLTGGTTAAGTPVFATDSLGLALWNAAAAKWTYASPNGPSSNSFVSVAVDDDGIVWGASGRSYGTGFSSYDGSRWTIYSTSTLPGLQSNNAFGIVIGPNNSKWISTWDSGMVVLNSTGRLVRTFDATAPGFVGLSANARYVVPAIAAFDRDGSMWTSIFRGGNPSRIIWKMNPDSSWVSYPTTSGEYNFSLSVTIDRNGTKWFANGLPGYQPIGGPRRIVYFNEKLALSGSVDGWGEMTEADGVTNIGISSVTEDREGQIWMGTDAGITIVTDPLRPLKSITKVFLGAVRDQTINCIAVDALNRKWIGTLRGVIVVSPDGTSLIDQYTVANSNGKLVSDNVVSIAFDTRRGVAYFGTEKGLSSVGIATIAPSADFSGISAVPSPFRPDIHPYVMIQGLAEGSTIKILTVSGKLVSQFEAQGGGRGFWNGKTTTGETVASGIYLAVAYSANGSQIGTAKVAVIRR